MVLSGLWRVDPQATADFGTGTGTFATTNNIETHSEYVLITNGATAGTIAYQWAQGTSNAGNTILR